MIHIIKSYTISLGTKNPDEDASTNSLRQSVQDVFEAVCGNILDWLECDRHTPIQIWSVTGAAESATGKTGAPIRWYRPILRDNRS